MPENNIQVIEPASRKEWLAARRQDITASAIGGLVPAAEHPFCTPYSLWAEKTGRLAPDDDLDSAALQRGRRLEGLAAEMATENLPADSEVIRNTANRYWRDTRARIGATPDLVVQNTRGRGIVQLKSVEPSIFKRTWIDGEPPVWIALQALTEAKLLDAKWAAVGVLRVGFAVEFDLIEIPLVHRAWQRMQEVVAEFWANVEAGTPPPPDFARDGATITAMAAASNGSTVDLSHDNELINALAEREQLKALDKITSEQIEAHDALIRHKAGEHEVVLAGEFRVSLRSESVKAYSVAARMRRPIRIKRIKEKLT